MADPSEGGFGLASFSSRGPTKDERMKPEISAPGVNISAPKAGSTNQYVVYSGTSMATPFDRPALLHRTCSASHRVIALRPGAMEVLAIGRWYC
jgi:hypothetical protein